MRERLTADHQWRSIPSPVFQEVHFYEYKLIFLSYYLRQMSKAAGLESRDEDLDEFSQ